jgi:hypothetical protein
MYYVLARVSVAVNHNQLCIWFQSVDWFVAIFHFSLLSNFLFIFTYESHPWFFIICWMHSDHGLSLQFFSYTLFSIINFNNILCLMIWPIHSFRFLTMLFHSNISSDTLSSTPMLVTRPSNLSLTSFYSTTIQIP